MTEAAVLVEEDELTAMLPAAIKDDEGDTVQLHTASSATVSNVAGLKLTRGQEVGLFNLGSSIVLIFEAPDTFEFTCAEGQRVKYGEQIGKHRKLD